MKNLLAVVLLVAPCLTGLSQDIQNRNVPSFLGVKVAEGIDVYLKKGDTEKVRVEATGTDADNVITEVSGSYLKVHMKDGKFKGSTDVKVYVTYKQIDKLSASSAGSIYSENAIHADDLEISSSSAGTIEIKVDVNNLQVSASSAGEIELQGKAKSLEADASSAGEIDADDLEAQSVRVEASSAGSVKVHVITSLNADASSGGSIRFKGNPSKSITNSSSGGSVKKTS